MSLKLRLSALTIAILHTCSANAATPTTMENITVTGDRFDTTPDQQLTVINTIEREEIDRLSPKSVTELLGNLPGLSVTSNGGAGQSASVSIRGTNSKHTLVLIDGVRMASATTGEVSFGAISPEMIERIEVVKGPRAAIWGSDAIGGVIQIFTRQLKSGEWFASTEYGSSDYARGTAGVGISHGDGSTSLTINKEKSDGIDVKDDAEEDKDGYHRFSLGVNGHQQLNHAWSLQWNGKLESGHYEYDSTRDNEADYDNYFANVSSQYQGDKYTTKVLLGSAQDKNEHFRTDVDDAKRSLFQTNRTQVNWSNRYLATDNITFIGGVDWANESIKGDYAVDSRDTTGAYALARVNLGPVLLEGAVRYDDVENIDSETSYSTSAAYVFNDQWRLTGSYGTAFKAPSFNDLYYPSSGNPDLISETSKNLDVTLNYSGDDVQGYISAFKNDVDNLIAWAPDAQGNWKPANVDKAEIQGIELSLSYDTWGIAHQLGYTYLDAVDASDDQQLKGRSENEFDYQLGYTWSKVDLQLNYHYQGKRSNGNDTFLDAYSKFDVSLGYKFADSWQLRLKGNNLTDQDLVSVNGYNAPGRQVFLSIGYQAF
ncbi:TonB-dependent receptor domain-containing protein [Shewanella intestini]|uniref:TonB-dependent receptor n=1 Tax=Shewanella intestini TaxID=2017544 RepID=A0ABS5I2B8_9GAMM|nr:MULTISPECIES: TonB-dependent receptor [Shewanella]MBR9727953.1 TonB-dependent receptor [Shewanella intestini]MRG36496.1 TonB-dependent receptor [Shewanella sp. XMDDZSB0408]